MYEMNTLALIPARGGSKGVVRKNIRLLDGRPLIGWTFESVKNLGDDVFVAVSTDDQEIANYSRLNNIEVIKRPFALASDFAPMVDVVRHAMKELEASQQLKFARVLLLQPTSPFRNRSDVVEAISQFERDKSDSLITVHQLESIHPSKMYRLNGGMAISIAPGMWKPSRQLLEPVYVRNGAIFISRAGIVSHSDRMWGGKVSGFVMESRFSIDIDTEDDFQRASLMGAELRERHALKNLFRLL